MEDYDRIMKEKDKKRKTVFVPNDLHLRLQETKLNFAKQGQELSFAEIIEAGLNCLDSKSKA